jgi:hypothetical protein
MTSWATVSFWKRAVLRAVGHGLSQATPVVAQAYLGRAADGQVQVCVRLLSFFPRVILIQKRW